eukprot:gene42867-17064_t
MDEYKARAAAKAGAAKVKPADDYSAEYVPQPAQPAAPVQQPGPLPTPVQTTKPAAADPPSLPAAAPAAPSPAPPGGAAELSAMV